MSNADFTKSEPPLSDDDADESAVEGAGDSKPALKAKPAASGDAAVPRARLLDSPWYWAYVFCAAALVALVIMQPKFANRQTLDERNFQGRQRANQSATGETPSVPLSTSENRVITLTPLYVVLGIGFLVCWSLVWWQLMGKKWWSKRT